MQLPFDQAKQRLRIADVVAQYTGQTPQRGKVCCPFHNDKNPSMQLKNERYRCFVCEAHGDAIDFAARYFRESPKAALARLDADFSLGLPLAPPKNQTEAQRKQAAQQAAQQAAKRAAEHARADSLEAQFDHWEREVRVELEKIYDRLHAERRTHAPTQSSEPPHPRYCYAVRNIDWLNEVLDIFLQDTDTRKELFIDKTKRKEIYDFINGFYALANA